MYQQLREVPQMKQYFQSLYKEILQAETIDTHSHHLPDDRFPEMTLEEIFRTSYVNWCGVGFDGPGGSRETFLDKVRYKSFFVYLEKSLMDIYGFPEKLTAENWDEWSRTIQSRHQDPSWHLELLRDKCKFRQIILDAYWDPGSDDGHPDLFTPTFRIDPLFFAYDKDALDHDDANASTHYGREFSSVSELMTFTYDLIRAKIDGGCICIKNAEAYDRPVSYGLVSQEQADKVFTSGSRTDEDIKNFQDYFFDQVCGIAAELKIPVQCHTGMGQLGGTRAINMLPLIRRHPDTVFSLMHGSFPWCSDILALLDMFRNVYADTVWLPHLSPKAGEIMLHELIECGTSDKVYWGCDSWHSEESYAAKLVMAECLAKVLSSKIEDGYLEEKDAHVLIRKIMRENAAEVFGERP